MTYKADVLIVTTTEVESRAVMKVFRGATGKDSKSEPISDRIYLDLGKVNGERVFMALSEMGAGGLGGSQESVRKGIEALSPSAVIMVGIAFGINERKQAIGDVLVSERLMLYDLQRVGMDKEGNLEIIPRGDRPHASPWLINLFQVANLSWDESKAKVRFGLILSGDKLVDSIDFRGQLLKFEPEAIGGEMEGAGLYVACQNSKVDWILVKAICDWADGHKALGEDERQRLAAYNAASFVLHVLRHAPLRREGGQREPITSALSESVTARRIIAFLEDRRVLYNPLDLEWPKECRDSVQEIRRFLTEEIGRLDAGSKLAESLRAMRASCRKYLDTTTHLDIENLSMLTPSVPAIEVACALGEMRGVFGFHIDKIACRHGLEIEYQLARILPDADRPS